MIEIYLDESGVHHDSQIVTVAAVWAEKAEWATWTIEWIKAKAPIKINHAVDCHNRTNEFEGWSREERDVYVRRILSVIRDHYIQGVIAAVDKNEIKRSLRRRFGIQIEKSIMVRGWYFVCLIWAIRTAWESLAAGGHENIVFVHEENEYGHEAHEAFLLVKDRMADSDVATLSIGSKRAFPPLQCADILAYEGNRQMRDFNQPLRKPLVAIDPTLKRFHFRKYDKSEVEPIVDFTADYLRRVAKEF